MPRPRARAAVALACLLLAFAVPQAAGQPAQVPAPEAGSEEAISDPEPGESVPGRSADEDYIEWYTFLFPFVLAGLFVWFVRFVLKGEQRRRH